MTVLEFKVAAHGVYKFAGAAMDAAAQLSFGDLRTSVPLG